jgi:hypothetical protein
MEIGSPIARVRTRFEPQKSKFKPGELWQLIGSSWQKVSGQAVSAVGPYARIEHVQDQKNPGPPYHSGGNFTSVKVGYAPLQVNGIGRYKSSVPVNLGLGFFPTEYRGGFYWPDFTGVDFTDAQYADTKFLLSNIRGFIPSLAAFYPMVDSQLRPKLNHADLGQAIAEIRDIPHMLKDTAEVFHSSWKAFSRNSNISPKKLFKGSADSWVNSQFAWAPFIRDLYSVFDLIQNYDSYVRDTTNRNGRWDHRRRVLIPDLVTETFIQGTGGMKCSPNRPPWLDAMVNTSASWQYRHSYFKREKTRVWATGDFKFYKPAFDMSLSDYDSGLNRIRRLSTIAGTDITPELVWKITPWSWCVDWFSNVGSVISAATAAGNDGVVSKNVFLMAAYTREIVLQQEINMLDRPLSFEFIRSIDTKQRGYALTPFNFGLLPGQLSAKQYSILGALGLSRVL